MIAKIFAPVILLSASTVLLPLAPSFAGSPGDPARGEEMAARLCTGCHAIEEGQPSPVPRAPALAALGQDWPLDNLYEAFVEGILTGHEPPRMPQFELTPEEADDLIAYLESL